MCHSCIDYLLVTIFKNKEPSFFYYNTTQNRPVNYLKMENEISKCSQIVAKIGFSGEKKNPKSLFYNNLGVISSGATRD